MRFTVFVFLIISIFFIGCKTTPNKPAVPVQTEQEKKALEDKKRLEEEKKQNELRERLAREEAAKGDAQRLSRNEKRLTRVQVNQEIVNWIHQLDKTGEDIERLVFYLDKSFSLEIEENDVSPTVDIANDGMLVINAPIPLPPINFSDIQQGKINSFTPEANETFVITTDAADKHVSMRFRKNAQHDYHYELYSMVIDSVNYNLVPLKPAEEYPLLYIYALIDEKIRDEREYTADFLAVHRENSGASNIRGEYPTRTARNKDETAQPEKKDETRVSRHPEESGALTSEGGDHFSDEKKYHENEISNLEELIAKMEGEKSHSEADKNKVGIVNEIIIPPSSNLIITPSAPQPPPPVNDGVKRQQNIRTANLMGKGSVSGDSVFNFVKNKTKSPVISDNEIKTLIGLYIEEAAFEEVNHDIAIAQMLYMTSILGNPDYVANNNFAGLTPVRGKWEDGKFPTMREGVRAHIQQLRGYARENLNRSEIVTPRWNMISDFRGSITTLDELSERWSSNPVRYKENIEKILSELYSF